MVQVVVLRGREADVEAAGGVQHRTPEEVAAAGDRGAGPEVVVLAEIELLQEGRGQVEGQVATGRGRHQVQVGALQSPGRGGLNDLRPPDPGLGVGGHGRAQAAEPVGRHQGVVVEKGHEVRGPGLGLGQQPVAGRGRADVDRQAQTPESPGGETARGRRDHGRGLVGGAVVQHQHRVRPGVAPGQGRKAPGQVAGLVPGVDPGHGPPGRR